MPQDAPEGPHPPLRSYGRLKSRPIKPRQEALFTSLLPTIAVPDGPVDPLALMPGAKEAWLEIGFGGGEHLVAQAVRAPDVISIGAEPFVNGVASALRHVEEANCTNVRILQGDARDLVSRLPDASIGRVFILFPDPWPKARHHQRRIIQADMIADLARVMRPGAHLRFASDWAEYVDWTLERLCASPHFRWLAHKADDWRIPPADHLTTRYEQKRLGDCEPAFLEFERV